MAKLFKPLETKIVTKDGECYVNIALELTIKLDSDGIVLTGAATKQKAQENDDDKVNFAIPDFSSGKKLKFGKEINK